MRLVALDRGDPRGLHVRGRVEIRFADFEMDDVASERLELPSPRELFESPFARKPACRGRRADPMRDHPAVVRHRACQPLPLRERASSISRARGRDRRGTTRDDPAFARLERVREASERLGVSSRRPTVSRHRAERREPYDSVRRRAIGRGRRSATAATSCENIPRSSCARRVPRCSRRSRRSVP